jgi:hypothetical protein
VEVGANITFLQKKKNKKKKMGSNWWDPDPEFLKVCRPTTSLLDFHFLCPKNSTTGSGTSLD